MHWCCCLGSLSAGLGGAAGIERSLRRRGRAARRFHRKCRGLVWGSSLIASFAQADLNNSGRGPSRRVPHWKEISGCPASDGTRDEAAPISCGGSCQSMSAADDRSHGQARRIDRGRASRRSHRFHQKRSRSGSAPPSEPEGCLPDRPPVGYSSRPVRAQPTTRDDDQRTTAAQCLHTRHQCNRLPRRPGQRRGLFRARRVCRARLKRN